MSIIHALQNGSKSFLESNANVNINLGNGNSNIAVTAKNAAINTGCGDQNITAVVSQDLLVDTGCCGKDNINAKVGGNAVIVTREDDDIIQLDVQGNFYVDAGMEDRCCGAVEDNDIVLIKGNLDNTKGCNYVGLGEGTDNVRIIGNNVNVDKADKGDLILGFYGDNYNINSDADNNMIGFWGDNVNMNLTGDGFQDVKTLDFSFELGQFTDFGFQDLLEQETYDHTDVDVKVEYALTGKNNIAEATKKYNLTCEQEKQLESLDLTKKTSNGQPYYVIYNDGCKNQIGYRDNAGNIYSMDGKKQTYSSSYTTSCSSTSTSGVKYRYNPCNPYGWRNQNYVTTTTTNYYTTHSSGRAYSNIENLNVMQEKEKTTTTTTTDYYNINGVKNININMKNNGNCAIGITANDGYVNINGKSVNDNDDTRNIIVRSGYVLTDVNVDVQKERFMEKINLSAGKLYNWSNSNSWSTSSSYDTIIRHWSPLVLDTNGDGKVSAAAGKGVDINLDGKADGAAVNGDKMLAMSDLNGNKNIDGTEVFGNNTVSPFTKQPLNAANGFEALEQIAKEAKQYTGIDCMNGSQVDIQKLAKALETVGVKLGFVSDNNTTELEDASSIKYIDVDNYTENNETGDVQHRQQGSFTWINGQTAKVDDVWFAV